MRGLHIAVFVVAMARTGCGPSPTPPSPAPQPSPPAVTIKGGIEVGWIARTPRLAPPATANEPPATGWPEEGRAVTWVAHVINREATTLPAVPYQWRVGTEQTSGVMDFAPGVTEVRLPALWTFTRHAVSFAIAPPASADHVTDDNVLTTASDALSLLFTVDRSTYDWMLEGGRLGFEAQLQREIARWNRMLAEAVYPTSPSGVHDRIRLDHVQVLPDGEELTGEDVLPWDLFWFFSTRNDDDRFLKKGVSPQKVTDQSIVLHELLHQRGLTDLYAYDVVHYHGSDAQVRITEGSTLVAGSFLMPAQVLSSGAWRLYTSPVRGWLMGSDVTYPTSLSEHSSFGLNLRAGRRTPRSTDRFGNLITPFGNQPFPDSYVWRLPAITELTFVDADGNQIAKPTVDVYADHNTGTYRETYGPAPDLTLAPTAGSSVLLPGDILEDLPPAGAPPKAQVLIFGVRTSQARGYAFLPVYYLNLEHFRGQHDRAALQIPVTMHAR